MASACLLMMQNNLTNALYIGSPGSHSPAKKETLLKNDPFREE